MNLQSSQKMHTPLTTFSLQRWESKVSCLIIPPLCATNFLKLMHLLSLDYGDKDNSDLAAKYDAKKDDFPVLKLFLQGTESPFTFQSGAFKADEIKKFVKQHSGITLGIYVIETRIRTLRKTFIFP